MDLTVITTHINADFDAVASMLAAQKLYPDAKVVFPGSQEKNLRNFFVNSMAYLFNMLDIKDVELDRIGRLVLVDTRQPHRIGKLADLLQRKGVDIHIYDHHPNQSNDIKGDYEVLRLTGATVTILAGILAEKKIEISPDEATIMCLGLYEDTGSFTFASTTQEDFKAAAFLLSKGANLNIVSNLMSREISPEQVSLLNEMIQAATRYTISGIEVVVTVVTTDKFVPDFAFLVHKMVKMENLEAIFAIALMENKIYNGPQPRCRGRHRRHSRRIRRRRSLLCGRSHSQRQNPAAGRTHPGRSIVQKHPVPSAGSGFDVRAGNHGCGRRILP